MSNESKDEFEMEYRMLGGTGLKVSALGLGTMSFDSVDQAVELMSAVRSFGVNFFDNAELYGQPIGEEERIFGKALKKLQTKDAKLWRRSDLVITTKLFFGIAGGDLDNGPVVKRGPNDTGVSRKHLMEGINESLDRMQLEYVDVIMAHRFDPLTPMKEIVEGFTDIIRSGKAFYWGTSMWTPQKLTEAYWVAEYYGLIAPVAEQVCYNMFYRDHLEYQLKPMFNKPYSMGSTVFSPLDGGILTGKYADKSKVDKDSRFAKGTNSRLAKWYGGDAWLSEEKNDKVAKLLPIAKEMKVSMVSLALGWVIKNKNVSTCLLGGRKASQLMQNKEAITAAQKLDKEKMDKIAGILGPEMAPMSRFAFAPQRTVESITDPM